MQDEHVRDATIAHAQFWQVLLLAVVTLSLVAGCNGTGPDTAPPDENAPVTGDDSVEGDDSPDADTALPGEDTSFAGADSVAALKDKVLAAVERSDKDGFISLYYLEGVTPDLEEVFSQSFDVVFSGDNTFAEVYIEEASLDEFTGVFNGRRLVWTAAPSRHIVLVRPEKDHATYSSVLLAAEIDGKWYLAGKKYADKDNPDGPRLTHIEKYEGPAANPRPVGGRDKYDLLEMGMPCDKVLEILGKPDHTETEDTGGSQVQYTWEFREGEISVGLTDNQVRWMSNTFSNSSTGWYVPGKDGYESFEDFQKKNRSE